MKCLQEDCDKEFESKTGRRKFCSNSCKMKYFRKHGKKDAVTKLDIQTLYNEFKSAIQNLAGSVNYGVVPTILDAPKAADLKRDEYPKYEAPAATRKPKSVIRYIEARLECENADDYDKWLADLESDPYLSNRDKQTAKTGTM